MGGECGVGSFRSAVNARLEETSFRGGVTVSAGVIAAAGAAIAVPMMLGGPASVASPSVPVSNSAPATVTTPGPAGSASAPSAATPAPAGRHAATDSRTRSAGTTIATQTAAHQAVDTQAAGASSRRSRSADLGRYPYAPFGWFGFPVRHNPFGGHHGGGRHRFGPGPGRGR